jgi:transglutaminase superfamily protein
LTIIGRLRSATVRLLSLFATNPGLVLRALVWRVALPVLKYLLPIGTLTRLMWVKPRDGEGRLPGKPDVVLNAWRRGGRLLVSPNCLERSLLLYRLLSREGANPTIVFGVDRGPEKVAGHAWVEIDGAVVHDAGTADYTRVATFGINGRVAGAR